MEKKKLLFLDSCVRGKETSRTLELCQYFIDELGDKYEVIHLDLANMELKGMDKKVLEERDTLLKAGQRNHPFFDLSRQFAQADLILVGAPYWDWSFPAVLKAYVEKISVDGITFGYKDDKCVGLCKMEKVMYICTAGGYIEGRHLGVEYIKDIFLRYGANEFYDVTAEGIDIFGNPVDEILSEAKEKICKIARNF